MTRRAAWAVLLAVFPGLALGERALRPTEIAALALPSTVVVICQDDSGDEVGLGSGFFVSPSQVATNHHVVDGCAKVFVRAVNQSRLSQASLARYDVANDVAVLSFPEAIGVPLPMDLSAPARIGEEIFAVGNPEGFEGTFSRGLISAIRRAPRHQLQISAPISVGSSGGPVLNDRGLVVGVTVELWTGGQNLNFATPISFVQELLEAPPAADIPTALLPSASPFDGVSLLGSATDVARPLRVVVMPFEENEGLRSMADVVASDLLRSGYFELLKSDERASAEYVVSGVIEKGPGRAPWRLRFELQSTAQKSAVLSGDYPVPSASDLSLAAHQVSEATLLALTQAPSPIGDSVVLVSASAEEGLPDTLLISDWDGFNVRVLAQDEGGIAAPAVSPDRSSVAYVAGASGALIRHDLVSGKDVELATGLNPHSSIDWSPDGRWIAASFSEGDNDRLYRVDARSGKKRAVTGEHFSERNPSFSPDGRHLAMTSTRSGSPQIYEVTLKDGSLRALTQSDIANGQGRYSPDGKRLLHTSFDGEQMRIQALDLANLESTLYAYGARPVWAAQGSLILFEPLDYSGLMPALALMNLSTGRLAPLRVTGHSGLSMPAWVDSPP